MIHTNYFRYIASLCLQCIGTIYFKLFLDSIK